MFAIATSLRARLILALSVLVGLVLFVGVASYGINEQVRHNVSDLRPSTSVDLNGIDLERAGLEFEGYWNPSGAFVATQVNAEPEPLQPKLRGELEAVSPVDRTITLYGRVIQVTDSTDGDEDRGGKKQPLRFDQLHRGLRAEVSCRVDASGRWFARQIETNDIKASNKVKGTITKAEIDHVAPEIVEIHGLRIVLQSVRESGSINAFSRIEQATEMLRALQKCRAAAHEASTGRSHGAESEVGADIAQRTGAAAIEMDRGAARFERVLAEARSGGDDVAIVPGGQVLHYLDALEQAKRVLQQHIVRMQGFVQQQQHDAALDYLSSQLEPFLDTEVLPFVYAYLSTAQEELGDELRGVLDRTQTTTRIALVTSVVAVLVAVVLGLMVWQSIQRPIRQLHDAAVALGQGRLDTRIAIDRRDEIGVLAGAFNSMAGQLAASTVSLASLEGMFDSMAAGVILCDEHATITNANRAAKDLVARRREEVVGRSLAELCRLSAGECIADLVASSAAAGGSMERVFVRKDGSELPVSLSAGELRTAGGTLQGYVFVAQDLTLLKRIEAQLRESLSEKELLLREVHHRVKNNMQVISSLLAMQTTYGDPEVQRRIEESQNRIRTIALIHEQLYQSTEVAHIDTRSYLNVLATHLLQSFGKAETVHLVQEVDNLELDLDESLACGLIVNELLTNSLKYAFPGDRRGTIRLVLRRQADGSRLLQVADDGCGLPAAQAGPSPSRRKTLGTSLIAKLARQLRGKVATDGSNGMTVSIVFAGRQPAEAVVS